ncbi:hypothetical protein [Acidiphilium acidophilum]|uniref:nucleotide-binding protein n=1 Tax=Acidiphilium acidophilum TaxID=76588 RepID=UPI002E8E652D|nr:hypothetical protein [Acidiphilium acidophilum]
MIFFSHGDKGGVGKSMAATVLVETLLNRGRRVVVVESDLKMPDVATRFSGVSGVSSAATNLNRAGDGINAVANFVEQVELAGAGADIVVNLPAGAGDTLDGDGEMLIEALREIGQRARICYSLGPSSEQASAFSQSLESGLCSAVDPADILLLLAGWQADQGSFVWSVSADRPAALASGVREFIVPRIQPDNVLDLLAKSTGRLSDFELSLPVFSRLYFHKWLGGFSQAVETLMPPPAEIVEISTAKKSKG